MINPSSQNLPARTIKIKTPKQRLEGGYTKVPNYIITHPKLNAIQVKIYIVLLMHSRNKNYCYPTQETIAREIGLTAKNRRITVNNNLKILETNGLIIRHKKPGGVCRYTVLMRVLGRMVLVLPVNKDLHPP